MTVQPYFNIHTRNNITTIELINRKQTCLQALKILSAAKIVHVATISEASDITHTVREYSKLMVNCFLNQRAWYQGILDFFLRCVCVETTKDQILHLNDKIQKSQYEKFRVPDSLKKAIDESSKIVDVLKETPVVRAQRKIETEKTNEQLAAYIDANLTINPPLLKESIESLSFNKSLDISLSQWVKAPLALEVTVEIAAKFYHRDERINHLKDVIQKAIEQKNSAVLQRAIMLIERATDNNEALLFKQVAEYFLEHNKMAEARNTILCISDVCHEIKDPLLEKLYKVTKEVILIYQINNQDVKKRLLNHV